MVPDTVQLIVEVAGLCPRAPALEMIRPRDGAVAQGPEEAPVPVFAGGLVLDIGKGAGDALPGTVDAGIHRRTVLALEPVLLVPDILRRVLQGDGPAFGAGTACVCLGHPLINLPMVVGASEAGHRTQHLVIRT